MKRIDLTGQHFGRLTALQYAGQSKNGNALWLCRCTCGNYVKTDSYRLRQGYVKSCGCLRREVSRKNIKSNEATIAQMGHPEHLMGDDEVNLVAMTQLNTRNRTGVIGVSFDKQSGSWAARMFFHGKLVLNSHFDRFADAVSARHAAERQYVQPLIEKHKQATAKKCDTGVKTVTNA